MNLTPHAKKRLDDTNPLESIRQRIIILAEKNAKRAGNEYVTESNIIKAMWEVACKPSSVHSATKDLQGSKVRDCKLVP